MKNKNVSITLINFPAFLGLPEKYRTQRFASPNSRNSIIEYLKTFNKGSVYTY